MEKKHNGTTTTTNQPTNRINSNNNNIQNKKKSMYINEWKIVRRLSDAIYINMYIARREIGRGCLLLCYFFFAPSSLLFVP